VIVRTASLPTCAAELNLFRAAAIPLEHLDVVASAATDTLFTLSDLLLPSLSQYLRIATMEFAETELVRADAGPIYLSTIGNVGESFPCAFDFVVICVLEVPPF
jgi:hypothetical protein